MLGLIRKSKVLDIIDKGENQLQQKQLEVIEMKGSTEEQKLDIRDSINKFEGGIYFLKCLKKHFY